MLPILDKIKWKYRQIDSKIMLARSNFLQTAIPKQIMKQKNGDLYLVLPRKKSGYNRLCQSQRLSQQTEVIEKMIDVNDKTKIVELFSVPTEKERRPE